MKLASLFTDSAVLQRNKVINVWGQGTPKQVIKGRLAGIEVYTVSSLTGEFMLRFPPMEAGGPHTLTVCDMSEEYRIVINDILIGEVWLASGQSNMEYRMQDSPDQMKKFIDLNENPDSLRMFTVGKNAMTAMERTCNGIWEKATPKNLKNFSAIASWFAYNVEKKLNVPIGIIHSSWWGSQIETWTSRGTLLQNPDINQQLINDELKNAEDAEFWKNFVYDEATLKNDVKGQICLLAPKDHENRGFANQWAAPDYDAVGWKAFQVPGSWISQKLCGNGAVWARKEVIIPEEWSGKNLWLDLGGIDKHDITYFNGVEIGRTGTGYETHYYAACRHYHVPGELVKSGKATISVRAFSFIYDGNFGGSQQNYKLCLDEDCTAKINLAGIWQAKAEIDFGIVSLPKYFPGYSNSYSSLFNGMIRPLIPYTVRGAIWNQGQGNAGTLEEAERYQYLMADLINDWRRHWEQIEFPFYMVTLAGYKKKSDYNGNSALARLRESQRRACLDVSDCAMASAVDCGEENELHPHDKKTVGERLAQLALAKTYKVKNLIPSGPVPVKICRVDRELHIDFDVIGNGLDFKDNDCKSFYIAGKDRNFIPADYVKISGSAIILKSSEIPIPIYVRYAWADFPFSTLFNSEDLPAFPFELELQPKDEVIPL